MRLRMRRGHALAATLAAGFGLIGFAPAASAEVNSCGPWSSQQDMIDSTDPGCRATWIVDPGQGHLLTREQLVRAAGLYADNGFSRRWLWYAPQQPVTLPGGFGPDWTSCPTHHVDGVCTTSNVQGTAHPIGHNFTGPVTMDVLAYQGNFIALGCGNFGMPLRPQGAPTPRVTGHKFEDRNADGVQQPDEPALAGWAFRLIRESSLFGDQGPGVVDEQTTGPDGRFTFALGDGAGPGTYRVEEVPQDDWAATTPSASASFVVPAGAGDSTVEDLGFGNFFQQIVAAGTTLSAVEGRPWTGPVATFTDPDPGGTAAEYAATIDWGDGTAASAGAIAKGADGAFTVTGAHTYAEEGHPTVTVAVADIDNPRNTATATSPATVDDAALTAAGRDDLLSTNPVADLPVATFTDANPGGPLADFAATVDWGDGTPATAGTISGATGGPFTVRGSHTYATLGPKTITTHIVDEGGSTATAVSHLIVYAHAAGGDFVVGDLSTGPHVTFWDAQWAKTNALSTEAAPAAFKGYADNPDVPACGGAWTSRPGNSSNPPAGVPTYMAVIVSSHVGQSGSSMSGDVRHVLIVRTDPGYAGNPGHAGTGEVVATLC